MTNISLKNLQKQMMNYLLHDDKEITDKIINQGNITKKVRLNIYKNAYQVRLTEVIDNDHQMLGLYLGDDLFEQMATEYLKCHPSSYYSLRDFAEHLPNFLTKKLPFSEYPIISELAYFERFLLTSFDASDTTRMTFDSLQTIEHQEWPALMFRFHPSVQLAYFSWNTVESWQALKQQLAPEPATHKKSVWLLWRNNDRLTEFRSLSEEELTLFNMILSGDTFSTLCDFLLNSSTSDDASALALQYLSTWLEEGLLRAPADIG
jgi:hypothetical protein